MIVQIKDLPTFDDFAIHWDNLIDNGFISENGFEIVKDSIFGTREESNALTCEQVYNELKKADDKSKSGDIESNLWFTKIMSLLKLKNN